MLAFTVSAVLFSSFTIVMAAGNSYVPLEPSAFNSLGLGSGAINTGSLANFLSKIFDFGIAIAVALSVVMIAWGGIQYMTTDSWYGKEDGKKKIEDAFYGLALALISWLILFIINPNLVTFTGNQIVN